MSIENAINNLFSKEQAACALGISTVTLQRKAKNGEIRQIKIGQTVRFDKEAINEYRKKFATA